MFNTLLRATLFFPIAELVGWSHHHNIDRIYNRYIERDNDEQSNWGSDNDPLRERTA